MPRPYAQSKGVDVAEPLQKLTLTQCYNFCSKHRLLCPPVDSLTSLRKWLDELKEFKPSIAARQKSKGAGLRAVDAAEASSMSIDGWFFSKLLNDLDPVARRAATAAPPR